MDEPAVLDQMLSDTVVKNPQKTAVVFGGTRLSYQELYSRVVGFGSGLTSIGIGPSDCIAVILPNRVEFVVAFFTAARLQSLFLPLNPLLKRDEIAQAIRECSVRAILTDTPHWDLCRGAIAAAQRPVDVILIDASCSQARDFSSLILPVRATSAVPYPPAAIDLLVQYSSGSTGRPKRIHRTQQSLFCESEQLTTSAAITSDDSILCFVPMFHAHGLGNCLLAAARSGATLVILDAVAQDGQAVDGTYVSCCQRICHLVESERITILPGVPYMFDALAEAPLDSSVSLSSVRLCFSAGNFLPRKTFDRFLQRFGIPIRQLYGCTEAGSVCLNLDQDVVTTWSSVGRPLCGVEVRILDEQARELPAESVGEIVFRSPAAAKEYVDRPDVNREAFRDGYFFTGDMGKKDAHGTLYITGRKKFVIDTGGYKVDPLEIEDVLMTHPHVAEAVVVGVGVPAGGEVVKAVIVPREAADQDEIVSYCRDRLADFKIPRIVEFVAEIPKSPLGKVLRKDLMRAQNERGASRRQGRGVRRTPLETRKDRIRSAMVNHLRREVGRLLNMTPSRIEADRPFSDFGVDSVTAVALTHRLEDRLARSLPATLVWNYPTIAVMAEHLSSMIASQRTLDRTDAFLWEPAGRDLNADAAKAENLSEKAAEQMLALQTEIVLEKIGDWSIDAIRAADPADADVAEVEYLSEERVRQLLSQQTSAALLSINDPSLRCDQDKMPQGDKRSKQA